MNVAVSLRREEPFGEHAADGAGLIFAPLDWLNAK